MLAQILNHTNEQYDEEILKFLEKVEYSWIQFHHVTLGERLKLYNSISFQGGIK